MRGRPKGVSGRAGRVVGRGRDGAAGFRGRREVNGRVRSSAPLLTGPSWPQCRRFRRRRGDGNPFSFQLGRALLPGVRSQESVGRLCLLTPDSWPLSPGPHLTLIVPPPRALSPRQVRGGRRSVPRGTVGPVV